MRWLSPLELDISGHGVRTDRFEGVGKLALGTKRVSGVEPRRGWIP